jgi:predicted component of viral defense system (DUF524 family)
MTQTNLGNLLSEKGELGPALRLLEEVKELHSKTPAADPSILAICRSNLGAVLTELRRFEEGARELLVAYAALEDSMGRDHEATREAATRLEHLAKLWRNPVFCARVRELVGT